MDEAMESTRKSSGGQSRRYRRHHRRKDREVTELSDEKETNKNKSEVTFDPLWRRLNEEKETKTADLVAPSKNDGFGELTMWESVVASTFDAVRSRTLRCGAPPWLRLRNHVLLLLIVLLMLPLRSMGQTSAHCPFNQLCTCKFAPDGGGGNGNGYSTEATFTGQFGTITTGRYDDFYSGSPFFNATSGSSSGSRVSGLRPAHNHHNIREISCVRVPFARIPGRG